MKLQSSVLYLQILYCMDAMWYEAYYFYSADYLNSGTGLSLISSYLTFPFLPTLITRSMISFNPEVGPITLVIVVLLNIVGYVIYRYKSPSVTALDLHVAIPGPRKLSAVSWPRIQSPRWMEFRQKMGPEEENLSCQVGFSHSLQLNFEITFDIKGWWSVVRHPNYTGEILVQWTWVLPLREYCPY